MKSCRKQDFDFALKTSIAHQQDETFEVFTLLIFADQFNRRDSEMNVIL